MTNNERIIAHNLLIDQAQAKVDALPTMEDLTTVLNEQEALITELETVLAEKAAGGGVETCTFEFTSIVGEWDVVLYNNCVDGEIEAIVGSVNNGVTYKAICNSILTIEGWGSGNVTISAGVVLDINNSDYGYVAIKLPVTPQHVTIALE